MATEIKFCGMTRAVDALAAASLGASYVGVIFAGGPRRLTTAQAASVFADLPESVGRAGVFADAPADVIAEAAHALSLDVVQLHGDYAPRRIEQLRDTFSGMLWSVVRIANGQISGEVAEQFALSDAVLLDALVPGKLGGTGVTLPWGELRDRLARLREGTHAKLVLAGGLRAENVAEAIRLLRPDVVDVSSGVETAPGIKDHARMRAFRDAVHAST